MNHMCDKIEHPIGLHHYEISSSNASAEAKATSQHSTYVLAGRSCAISDVFADFMTFGSVGLHVVERTGIIQWANQAELDLLGYTAEEYIGSHIAQYHQDPEILSGVLTTLLSGCKVQGVVAPLKCKDGHTEYVEINSSMRQIEGKYVTTRCFSVRVTDRVLLERKQQIQDNAQETRRNKDFLRKLCHEICNPLGGVVGNLDLLLRELQDEPVGTTSEERLQNLQQKVTSAVEYAKLAQLATEHQMLVVNDTLTLSRLESQGTIDFCPQICDVQDVLDAMYAILGVQAQEKDIHLDINNKVAGRIRTDPSWLKRILLNLVGNAIKFTSRHGHVNVIMQMVQSECSDPHLHIVVQDNGAGIDDESMSKLFKKKGGDGTYSISGNFGGNGLGLLIVKSVLDDAGGTISVQSKKDIGSTFEVKLPCEIVKKEGFTEESAVASVQDSAVTNDHENHSVREKDLHTLQSGPSKNCRILVVDDNHINRKMLASYLRRAGYTNHELAENGQVAYDLHERNPFDIILTDVDMPILDGMEFTRKLRRQESESKRLFSVPIIGISGNALADDVKCGREVGMNEYMRKPYKFNELEALIVKYIQKRGE